MPAEGNGDLQTLICVLVVRPRRCPTFSNPVRWQNWMAAYLGYTLRMKTLFRGWPVMVHDTHAIRRRLAEHRRRTLQTDQKHCRINYVYYILQMHTVCNVCSALCLNAWPKYLAKQRFVMGIGICLHAQLVQTKNKQCKSAIILQRYYLHLSDFCSRPRLTQPYNHIVYPGVAKIYLVFFESVCCICWYYCFRQAVPYIYNSGCKIKFS